jgi:hypothetical protein
MSVVQVVEDGLAKLIVLNVGDKGDKGDTGDTGDVTPELQAASDAAVAAAGVATASSASAMAAKDSAQGSSVTAGASAAQAQNSLQQVLAAGKLYGTVNAALTDATLAVGASFSAPLADGSIQGYTKTSGTVATAVGLPLTTQAVVAAIQSILPKLTLPGYMFNLFDAIFQSAFGVKDDGTTMIATANILSAYIASLSVGSFTPSQLQIGGAVQNGLVPPGVLWDFIDQFFNSTFRVFLDGSVAAANLRTFKAYADNYRTSVVQNAAYSAEDFVADITHIISYGQSNSLGHNASPVVSLSNRFGDLMFNGGTRPQFGASTPRASFVPLVESITASDTDGETCLSGFCEAMHELLARKRPDFASSKYQFFCSAPGQGGTTLANLSKGSVPYANAMADITAAFNLAKAAGKTYKLAAVAWNGGEADEAAGTADPVYQTGFVKLQSDFTADYQAITGNTNEVVFICTQGSNWVVGGTQSGATNGAYPAIPLAQLAVANANPTKFVISTPTYMLPYGADNLHQTALSQKVIGAYHARSYEKAIIEGSGGSGLRVRSTKVTAVTGAWLVDVRIVDPVGSLVFDTSVVSDPGNYGTSVVDSTGAAIAQSSAPRITQSDTVRLTLASNPVGGKLRFGFIGGALSGPTTGPRCCLRDSAGDRWTFNGGTINRAMHNAMLMCEIQL